VGKDFGKEKIMCVALFLVDNSRKLMFHAGEGYLGLVGSSSLLRFQLFAYCTYLIDIDIPNLGR